jgi:prepilin-type N-terminal cleavage/methylation domain-containing protein
MIHIQPGSKRRAFTIVELLVVISIIALLVSLLLPTLSQSRNLVVVARCQSNHRQAMVALTAYATDQKEYPYLMDWTSLDAYDMPTNQGTYISDNLPTPTLPNGFTTQYGYGGNAFALAHWVAMRKLDYFSDYRAVQCSTGIDTTHPVYDRDRYVTTTVNGYFLSFLTPDSSLYRIYEAGAGTSLAVRNHGNDPFTGLYTDPAHARSTSERGISFKDVTKDGKVPSKYSWTICPGRTVNTWTDPAYPLSNYGGYSCEPHGTSPISDYDPLFSGSPWADYWNINNVHYVERVVGFNDGHAVYDHRITRHDPSHCPEDVTPGQN